MSRTPVQAVAKIIGGTYKCLGGMISFRTVGSRWQRCDPSARWAWCLLLAVSLYPSVARSQSTFTLVDVPGASSTTVNAINNSGAIVGGYNVSAAPNQFGVNHGFSRSQGVYQTIDVPGALALCSGYNVFKQTATGINDGGEIIGYYDRLAPIYTPCGGGSYNTLGFSLINGAFQDIDNASYTGLDYTIIYPSSINDNNAIVGYYNVFAGRFAVIHAFLLQNGGYTNIDVPGAAQTWATGINNVGQIVGYYEDPSTGNTHGFLLSGGVYTTVDAPDGLNSTQAVGINGSEQEFVMTQ